MLQFILLQNRQGKTRLSKYYRPYTDEERLKIETEVHRIVTTRDAKFTNFVEFRSYKLIYRRYAGLFFTLAVDVHDNELLYFESIHLFVELLDQFFGNVCELDLVFNFNKVRALRPPARRRRPRRDERRRQPPRTLDPRARVPSVPPRCILVAPFPPPRPPPTEPQMVRVPRGAPPYAAGLHDPRRVLSRGRGAGDVQAGHPAPSPRARQA
jgi:hypothetical protein